LKRKKARPGSLAALDRRRHYRRRPTRRSRHQHRRRSRAPSSAPESANNDPLKRNVDVGQQPQHRPAGRCRSVCVRARWNRRPPRARERTASTVNASFRPPIGRSAGRSSLSHRPPPAPTTTSPPINQKRNRPLRRQGQIPTALGSASRARETTQSTLRRLATDAQKLDQLSGATH
jgi:hypothetical protein